MIESTDDIANAYILFDVDEVRPGQSDVDTTINIFGEANVNPALPTDANGDVSSRAATAAAVAWQPPATAETHADLVTPDISPVVREIIAMPGWNILKYSSISCCIMCHNFTNASFKYENLRCLSRKHHTTGTSSFTVY